MKKLHIGSSLTLELSKALELADDGLLLLLLPELQEVEVPLKIDHATNALFMFMKARESVGRPVHLPIGSLEVAVGPSLSAKETEAELPPKSLAAQAGPRPKLEDASRKEKKRWQARALAGFVWRLRGKNQN